MMTGKIPDANPQHYLLPRAAGRAALKKLSWNYPDPVKWIHQEQKLNDRTVRKGDYPIKPSSVPSDFWPALQPVFWLPEFEAPKVPSRLFRNHSRPLPCSLSRSRSKFY